MNAEQLSARSRQRREAARLARGADFQAHRSARMHRRALRGAFGKEAPARRDELAFGTPIWAATRR